LVVTQIYWSLTGVFNAGCGNRNIAWAVCLETPLEPARWYRENVVPVFDVVWLL
jgi:hypothetical protein